MLLAAATKAAAMQRQSLPVILRSSLLRSTVVPCRGFAKGSPTHVVLHERREADSLHAVQGTSGRHTLCSDLMPEAGGADKGPSPKEYVLAALGSCTLITMRMYSDAMISKGGKWGGKTIEKMSVTCSEHGDDHHVPLGIEVRVSLKSNLDEEQIQRLMTAAGKCPVKRMLSGGIKEGITTVLVKDS
jgi:putative redox protein